MAQQKVTGGLMAKYGAKLDEAVKKHAQDETTYGFVRLPGGITNGIAQLKEVGFGIVEEGKRNAGEWYLRAMGVVVEPTFANTPNGQMQVAGVCNTSIIEMVCDTQKSNGEVVTQEQHVANILNILRQLGAQTAGAGGRDMERLAQSLQQACLQTPIYFKFSTSLGKLSKEHPEPRVFENWHGTKGLENYTPPDVRAANTEDDTPVEEMEEVQEEPVEEQVEETPEPEPVKPVAAKAVAVRKVQAPAPNKPAVAANKPVAPKPVAKKPVPQPEPEPEEEAFNEFGDLTSVLERADAGDEDAQKELSAAAVAAGASEEDVRMATTWQEVYDLIDTATKANEEAEEEAQEAEEEAEQEPESVKPRLHLMVGYTPPKGKRQTECKVTEVDPKTKTVTLKNMDDGKSVYTKVAWASLVSLS